MISSSISFFSVISALKSVNFDKTMNFSSGIIGSGVPETYEMLRVIKYAKSALIKFGKAVAFPVRV